MENIDLSQFTIPAEDEKYIDDGVSAEDKDFRRNLIISALILNGAYDDAQPGVAIGYLLAPEYYHRVEIPGLNAKVTQMYEQALNWHALGEGKGGLAGASVRWALRSVFEPQRESKIVKVASKDLLNLAKEYAAQSVKYDKFMATWHANAHNVVALAASCFIRECHHWNAQNTKAIKAFLGSISQENEIPESEYRKLFYLSIHPVPLHYFSIIWKKAKAKEDVDLAELVKTRLNVAPSGYADICACAIAGRSYLKEDYARKSAVTIEILKLVNAAEHIKKHPLAYHPFAAAMQVEKVEFEKTPYHHAMVVLAAYAKACIGGTLSNSPALTKFTEANLREVNILVRSFKDYNERKSEDLMAILAGSEKIDYDNIVDKIKPIVKVAERIATIAERDDDTLKEVVRKLHSKISDVVDKLDSSGGKDIDFSLLTLDFKDGGTLEELLGGSAIKVVKTVI